MGRKAGLNVRQYFEQLHILLSEVRNVKAYVQAVEDAVKAGGHWPPYVNWPEEPTDKEMEVVIMYTKGEGLLSMPEVAKLMEERYEESWTPRKVQHCLRKHELWNSRQWLKKARECGLL